MKTQPYFEIKINAKSVEELEKRIADSQLRGFDLVRNYEINTDARRLTNTCYTDAHGEQHRCIESIGRTTYGAVLRRPNDRASE